MSACGRDLHYRVGEGHAEAFFVRCHCWQCEACAPFKLAKLRREIEAGEPDMLLTLTVNPSCGESPSHRAVIVKDALQLLVKRMARLRGLKRIDYFCVVESTKRGEPHLHVALRCPFIAQKIIAGWWRELTGAHIVDVRRIRSQRGIAKYLSKYISKAPVIYRHVARKNEQLVTRSTRRFSRTNTWRVVERKKHVRPFLVSAHRCLKHCSLRTLAVALQGDGWQILKLSSEGLVAIEPRQGAPPPLWECTVELETFRQKFRACARDLAA